MTYNGLIFFCVYTTLALSIAFGLLVLHRWMTERRAPIAKARQGAIAHSYLQRVGGFAKDNSDAKWSKGERIQALGHLLLLLRGGDRDRLIQLAEIDGLLKVTLRQTKAWRAARRIDAIRTLQQFGGEAAIARMRHVLGNDRHRIVRLNAAFALASFGRLPPPRETIQLLDMPKRRPTRLDIAILRAMAPDYAEHLVRLLDEELPHSRRAAIVDALGWSGDQSVLLTLEQASKFEDIEVRCAALRAGAKLGHHSVAEWVVEALSDDDPNVRVQAVNSASALGLVQAVPLLQSMVEDRELWVRLRAAEALEILTPDTDIQRASA